MHARILKGPGRWAEVSDAWAALLAPSGPRSFEQRTEWARALAQEAHGDDARWLVAEDEEGPVAALPYLVGMRRYGPLRVRVLSNEWGTDGLAAARLRPAALRRVLLDASADAGEPIDVLSLNRLIPGSTFLRLATAAPSGLSAETRHGGCSVIDTVVDGDEWFAAASKNLRASLRKARNRFERQGAMTVTVATSADEIAAAFDEYVTIEASGWKGDKGALANRSADRALMRAFLLDAACAHGGASFVRTLRLDGRPAAAQLGCVTGRTLELLKVAYDDALADLSPSNLLMADLVRDCCDRRDVDRIDLITHQPWHERWHPEVIPTYQARDADLRRPGGLATRGAALLEQVGVRLPKP